tara:strand:- start:249 stop:794 length:546 start_codon:yes stop_codon:yes gene_type:complete
VSKKKIRKKILFLRKKKYNINLKINYLKLKNILNEIKIKKSIIGGYIPVKYEIDCLNILNDLERKGYKISLPVIKKNNQMEFCRWSHKEPLVINKFGIPEPKFCNTTFPDVLFVPLVGFDKKRYRIGYGGGYYDRYLQKLNKKKNFLSIGFAFSFQQINKVPINKYDEKLDLILTERSIFK